jgi:hypothetical protein
MRVDGDGRTGEEEEEGDGQLHVGNHVFVLHCVALGCARFELALLGDPESSFI